MAIESPYPIQLLIKNTFLHFDIDHFDIKIRKRSASAPPRVFFSKKTEIIVIATELKKRKRDSPKKLNINNVLDEFAQLVRRERWMLFGKLLVERQERIKERWRQVKYKLLQDAPTKKKKRFTLTKRLFLNAAPWVSPTEILRARKNGFFRPAGPDSMEVWASDVDLLSRSISHMISVFGQFRDMVQQRQMMMMLPCGNKVVFTYRPDLPLDDLRAKVKDASSQPYVKQRLICQGQSLEGSRILGDFDVCPGDVISVLLR